jgi:hypothetical protein
MLPLYDGPKLRKTSQAEQQIAKDGLLGYYKSNENSPNISNGSPPWTPPTKPAGGSGGHCKKLQTMSQSSMETQI